MNIVNTMLWMKRNAYQESTIAKVAKTIIEKFNETRTIRIKGKNVDDLNLEKIANLIQQANEKSSNVKWQRLSEFLKKALP